MFFQLNSECLAQPVNRLAFLCLFIQVIPHLPAIAWSGLDQAGNLVDRPAPAFILQGSIGHHPGGDVPFGSKKQGLAWFEQAVFQQGAKGQARGAAWVNCLVNFRYPDPQAGYSKSAARASQAYCGSLSIPIQCRWSLRATTPVVPVPKNGSRTTSPGFELARITR